MPAITITLSTADFTRLQNAYGYARPGGGQPATLAAIEADVLHYLNQKVLAMEQTEAGLSWQQGWAPMVDQPGGP